MPRLPVVSGQEARRALERLGYRFKRQKGSHVRLYHVSRAPVTVPLHVTLDRGTLRAILRSAGVSVEEFLQVLKG